MIPEFLPIIDRVQDTEDTFTLTLEPSKRFAFAPGQFNMLYVPSYGEVPISISGDPDSPEKLVHTVRSVGGVTAALSRLEVGEWVGVRGPFGTAWPQVSPDEHAVFVAGGIGLAPLRPGILRAIHGNAAVFLVYGARTPADLLYGDELATWASLPNTKVVVTVDRGDPEWHGCTGVVTKYLGSLAFDPSRARISTCGPEIMMRFVAREAMGLGVPPNEIHVSLERNMKCGIGHCGHCQLGPHLLCQSGPVLTYDNATSWMSIREL